MRYVATTYKNVIVSKGINHTDYVDKNEIELTEAQYNSIPIPCKLVDGEFVSCEMPEIEPTDTPTEPTEPTTDEILNALLGVADNE